MRQRCVNSLFLQTASRVGDFSSKNIFAKTPRAAFSNARFYFLFLMKRAENADTKCV